jgi:AcrR family transcriptional regulator
VSSVRLALADDGTVRDRLIRAADTEITLGGIGALKMEAVAKRAGVSRATAFRQLGTVYELLVQVALTHAKRHEISVRAVMANVPGALAKVEAAFVYTVREIPQYPSIYGLIAEHSSSSHHPSVHSAGMRVLEPVLLEGRRKNNIRNDIGIDELVDYLVEQTYVATRANDRSECAIRRRFRHFILPGLAAPSGCQHTDAASRSELQAAARATVAAAEDLVDKLRPYA